MSKANYGIDAPHVVRVLFFSSLALFVLTIFATSFWFWTSLIYFLSTFIPFIWMLYGTKVAKRRIAAQMIESLELKGDETVLDLGCGRGLLLIEIAKNLPRGSAYGIDLWQSKDQSGNSIEMTKENARREGVKVSVQTGDMRALPFADSSFDVVVSSLAIHNVKERKKVFSEMLRVMKPGGKYVIADIHYINEYAAILGARPSKPYYSYCPPLRIISGINQSFK